LLVGLVFVRRSFYSMRLPVEKSDRK